MDLNFKIVQEHWPVSVTTTIPCLGRKMRKSEWSLLTTSDLRKSNGGSRISKVGRGGGQSGDKKQTTQVFTSDWTAPPKSPIWLGGRGGGQLGGKASDGGGGGGQKSPHAPILYEIHTCRKSWECRQSKCWLDLFLHDWAKCKRHCTIRDLVWVYENVKGGGGGNVPKCLHNDVR